MEKTDGLPGGSTPSQYALPEGAREIQDLTEFRNMRHSVATIFETCYRMGRCKHSDELRDARKILWFAERLVAKLEKESADVAEKVS